jgi:hypothetical protein
MSNRLFLIDAEYYTGIGARNVFLLPSAVAFHRPGQHFRQFTATEKDAAASLLVD